MPSRKPVRKRKFKNSYSCPTHINGDMIRKQFNQKMTQALPDVHQQLNKKNLPPRLYTKPDLMNGGMLREATVTCSPATPSNNASLNH